LTPTADSIVSPVTGEVLGYVADTSPDAIEAAVARARHGVAALNRLTMWERADLLEATAAALAARRHELIEDHLLEHGKTRSETDGEITVAITALESTAAYARRLEGRIVPTRDRDKRVFVSRGPLGIVAAITPWNAPILVPFEYIAPALAMGNAVLWKPAESVPHASRHLAEALAEADWPDGAIQMLTGGPATGAALAGHPRLDAVCFTGSSEVGAEIAGHGGMRKLILELGGNGPTIVFADADVQRAAQRIVEGAKFFSGQSCAATELVLVERGIEAELSEAVVKCAQLERVGDPREAATTVGPLHLGDVAAKVSRHVADARVKGARLLLGGRVIDHAPTANYWPLTVLAGVTTDMDVFREETFGPVIPITMFESEPQALELARIGGYGLSSAVFSRDLARALRVADQLPASSVVINNTSNYWETHLPWGGGPGTKSGIGRLGGTHALHELSTTKTTIVELG
jgi:succinate-semialdehyde dehydrogenase/glutarate-semialdehyde dehydrogenase